MKRILSSRQKRLINELRATDPELELEFEPEPEKPVRDQEQKKPAKTTTNKIGDAEKILNAMAAVHKLEAAMELIQAASTTLTDGKRVPNPLNGLMNNISGAIASPLNALRDTIVRVRNTIDEEASGRGDEAEEVYNQLRVLPSNIAALLRQLLIWPNQAKASVRALDTEDEEAEEAELPAESALKLEAALDEIGLTDSERMILYGALNEAVTSTGNIAVTPFKPRKTKKKELEKDLPNWWGKYYEA